MSIIAARVLWAVPIAQRDRPDNQAAIYETRDSKHHTNHNEIGIHKAHDKCMKSKIEK